MALKELVALLANSSVIEDAKAKRLLEIMDRQYHYMLGSGEPVIEVEETHAKMDERMLQLQKKLDEPIPPHTYCSFSGVDTDVFIIKGGEIRRPGTVQGVSVRHRDPHSYEGSDPHIMGSIIVLQFMEGSLFRVGDKFDLVLQSMNEYGRCTWMGFEDLAIIEHGTGISVDDITVDDNFTFKAKKWHVWTKGQIIRMLPKEEGSSRGVPAMIDCAGEVIEGLKMHAWFRED
jgi:hypothetical protein